MKRLWQLYSDWVDRLALSEAVLIVMSLIILGSIWLSVIFIAKLHHV